MADRLEHFDNSFTEILIGLAIALLIAIGFAPKLVSVPPYQWLARLQYGNDQYVITMDDWPDPIVCPICKKPLQEPPVNNEKLQPLETTKKGKKNGRQATPSPSIDPKQLEPRQQAIFKENMTCVKDGWQVSTDYLTGQTKKWSTWPKNGKKLDQTNSTDGIRVIDLQYKEAGFWGWWKARDSGIILLWLAICAFCVKLLHEQSAMRYLQQRSEMEIKGSYLFVLWLSRIVLLLMLYLVIISVYINGYGRLGESDVSSSKVFAILLIFSYVVPDLFLYSYFVKSNSSDQTDKWFKDEVVWKWIALDLVNVVIAVILITGASDRKVGVISSILCVVALLIWALLGYSKYQQGKRTVFSVSGAWLKNRDTRAKKATQVLVLVFIVVLVVLFITAKEYEWRILAQDNLHNAAMLVLGINLSDWLWNRRFFFGKA